MTARDTVPSIIQATTEFARLAELPECVGLADEDTRKLRIRLLAEEFHEYLDGESATVEDENGVKLNRGEVILWGEPDPVEIADGLADVIVIAWGTLLTYFGEEAGLEVLREVWSSNLSKVDGSLGPIVRRDDGKLLKPEGWQPPDVAGVLRRHGFLDPLTGPSNPQVHPETRELTDTWVDDDDEPDTGIGTDDPHGDINGGLT